MSDDNFDAMLKGAVIGMVSYFIAKLALDFLLPDLDFWFNLYASIMLIPGILMTAMIVSIIGIKRNIREIEKSIEERRRKKLENL